MDIIKIIGIGLIGVLFIAVLKQYKPEFALYVSLICGLLIFAFSMDKFSGIIDLINKMANIGSVNYEFLSILLKITGISFLSEFAISISKDCGETAIANKIELGGKVLIVAMSIPIISALLENIVKILP